MRKIVFTMGMSLDGFMEGPNREIDWHLVDDELHQHFNDRFATAGAFFEGRVTYELMEEFWPTADEDPDAEPTMAEFAQIWRATPKVVYSRTLEQVGPNATIVREVVPDEVRALLAQPGGDVTVGGAELAAEFRRHDLIDEYWVYVHPVLIGRGNPMFTPSDTKMSVRLVDTHVFGNGVVLLRYDRAIERDSAT